MIEEKRSSREQSCRYMTLHQKGLFRGFLCDVRSGEASPSYFLRPQSHVVPPLILILHRKYARGIIVPHGTVSTQTVQRESLVCDSSHPGSGKHQACFGFSVDFVDQLGHSLRPQPVHGHIYRQPLRRYTERTARMSPSIVCSSKPKLTRSWTSAACNTSWQARRWWSRSVRSATI